MPVRRGKGVTLRPMRSRLVWYCVVLGLVVGCATGGPVETIAPPAGPPTVPPGTSGGPTGGDATPGATEELPIADPALDRTAELARTDLAARLRIEPSKIEIVRAERVTWPDGSLGCPTPGHVYPQGMVEGARLILGIAGPTRIFVYHAGADGMPFLCPSDEPDGGHDFVPPPGMDT